MRLLLDTNAAIWLAAGTLDKRTDDMLADTRNDVWFSAINIWEAVIKRAKHPRTFLVDPFVLRKQLLDNGYQELAVTSQHALQVGSLPMIHGDPFDRLLVAQAMTEGLTLVTADSHIVEYSLPTIKVDR
jgi:PIN domain nuclease of toxin-antitoxin system